MVKAGNVFRSITRTERAHCKLNTHAHTEHVFLMKAVYKRAGQPYSMRSSAWVYGYVCVYVPIAWFCVCSALNYHFTVHTWGVETHLQTAFKAISCCVCVYMCAVMCLYACFWYEPSTAALPYVAETLLKLLQQQPFI